MFGTIWDFISAPFRITKLWSENNKKQAIGVGTVVVAKTAGALILWYNPWIILQIGLNYGLPVAGIVGPAITKVIISGIKMLF